MSATLARPNGSTLRTVIRSLQLDKGTAVVCVIAAAWLIASLPLWTAALTVASLTAAVLLVRWPWLIWLAIAAALPFSSGMHVGLITVTEILLAVALLLWLSEGSRRQTLRLYVNPILIPILIYIGVLAASSLRAEDLAEAVAEMVKWIEFVAVAALVPAAMPRQASPWLAAALVAGGLAQALLGLYQFVFVVGPEWFVLFDRYMRASGSFRQPNPYAAYLGLVLPLAVSLALHAWVQVLRRASAFGAALRWAVYYSVASAIIAAGLLASWSRGGWLGAAAGLTVALFLRSRKALMALLAVAVLAAGATLFGLVSPALVPAGVRTRLLSLPESFRLEAALTQTVTDENFSAIERLAHWVAALRMWEKAPWLGIGPGNYAAAYDSVRLPLWEEALGHAHNLYLNVLAETGVIGLLAFAAMWLALVAWVWRRRQASAAGCVALSLGVLGAVAHTTIHNAVDNVFVRGNYLHLALLIALLSVSCVADCCSPVSRNS